MSAAPETAWPDETLVRQSGEIIRAELNYLVPMRERAYRYEEEIPRGALPTNMRHRPQSVAIENARIGRPPTLDREGLAFESFKESRLHYYAVTRALAPTMAFWQKARRATRPRSAPRSSSRPR